MNVLVTGACGLIGEKICSGILKKENKVTATDINPSEYNEGKVNYRFVQADVYDRDVYDRLFKEEKFDVVVHCACTVDNDLGYIITEKEIKRSAVFDSFIYTSSVAAGVKKFILISTSQVYELTKTREPIRETDKLRLTTNYAKLKYDSERKLASSINKQTEMIAAVLRIAPIYTSSYLDNLINKILDSDEKMFVYRNGDYGFQFCCLHNLVDFILCFMKIAEDKKYIGIYNVSDPNIISVREIIKFARSKNKYGPVIQRNIGSDMVKAKLARITDREQMKSNYRYNDLDTYFYNNVLDGTKSNSVCTFRWNIDNTK